MWVVPSILYIENIPSILYLENIIDNQLKYHCTAFQEVNILMNRADLTSCKSSLTSCLYEQISKNEWAEKRLIRLNSMSCNAQGQNLQQQKISHDVAHVRVIHIWFNYSHTCGLVNYKLDIINNVNRVTHLCNASWTAKKMNNLKEKWGMGIGVWGLAEGGLDVEIGDK